MNKSKRSRLAFYLSVKDTHIGFLSYIKTCFLRNQLKLYMKTPKGRKTKFYTNGPGHMTKILAPCPLL